MVTDRARSPLLMKVMTLLDVPPGQVPTRTTPTEDGAQVKGAGEQIGKERHNKKLRHSAQEDVFWPLEDEDKILKGQGGPHPKHNNTKEQAQDRDTAHFAEDPAEKAGIHKA